MKAIRVIKKRESFISALVVAVTAILFPVDNDVYCKEKVFKYDTNQDGMVDQIVYLDGRGRPVRVEIDSNADDIMDRFQYYEKGKPARVEGDTDYDQKIDCWDYYEKGKRVRQERDCECS